MPKRPMHSEYSCPSWMGGARLLFRGQTFPSPPSWKRPQKQRPSQLRSKRTVFTLPEHCAAPWPRTQAIKPLRGSPCSRLAPASPDLFWHHFPFPGSCYFPACSSSKCKYLQTALTAAPKSMPFPRILVSMNHFLLCMPAPWRWYKVVYKVTHCSWVLFLHFFKLWLLA